MSQNMPSERSPQLWGGGNSLPKLWSSGYWGKLIMFSLLWQREGNPTLSGLPQLSMHSVLTPGAGVCVCARAHTCACMLSCVQLSVTPWTVACLALLFMGFSRQGYWSGLPSLLQGIFPDQAADPSLPHWPLAPSLGKPAPKCRRKKPKNLEGGQVPSSAQRQARWALRFWWGCPPATQTFPSHETWP